MKLEDYKLNQGVNVEVTFLSFLTRTLTLRSVDNEGQSLYYDVEGNVVAFRVNILGANHYYLVSERL